MSKFTRSTDDECIEAYDTFTRMKNKTRAAQHLGISRRTLDRKLDKYFARNLDKRYKHLDLPHGTEIQKESHVLDKFGKVKQTSVKTRQIQEGQFEVPRGHVVKGVSSLIDSQGNLVQEWVKTKEGEYDPLAMAEMLREVFADFEGPVFKPVSYNSYPIDILTLYPMPDMHLGLFAWKGESQTDWDLSIAIDKYEQAMQRVGQSAMESDECVVLGGGDFLHADNSQNRTLQSGNILDVDTRYAKVFQRGAELLVYQVEIAKKKHNTVHVRILPGNHDEHTAIALTWFLHAWFRNDSRVVIDTDPSVYWYRQFGLTMLAATHGHAAKLVDMPMIMAGREPKMWGNTEHRYAHGFHVHHKTQRVFEAGSVITESHQAPTPQDEYHFSKGYLAGRSMSSISYHRDSGEISRTKVVL